MKDQESKETNNNNVFQESEDHKSYFVEQLQNMNNQLQEIQNEINGIYSFIKSVKGFLSKMKLKIDRIDQIEETLNLLVDYNEFKEGYTIVYNGIHGYSVNADMHKGID